VTFKDSFWDCVGSAIVTWQNIKQWWNDTESERRQSEEKNISRFHLSTINPTSIWLESKSGLWDVRRRPIIRDMHGLNVFGVIQRTKGRYFPKSQRPDQLVSVRETVIHLWRMKFFAYKDDLGFKLVLCLQMVLHDSHTALLILT